MLRVVKIILKNLVFRENIFIYFFNFVQGSFLYMLNFRIHFALTFNQSRSVGFVGAFMADLMAVCDQLRLSVTGGRDSNTAVLYGYSFIFINFLFSLQE